MYPHVIWRVPIKSEIKKREEGLKYSQNNIEYMNQNTTVYRTRAERAIYLATVVNKNFISNIAAAQPVYEFLTSNVMPKSSLSTKAIAAARFALNCRDPYVVVDMRKMNGRVNNALFDPL